MIRFALGLVKVLFVGLFLLIAAYFLSSVAVGSDGLSDSVKNRYSSAALSQFNQPVIDPKEKILELEEETENAGELIKELEQLSVSSCQFKLPTFPQ